MLISRSDQPFGAAEWDGVLGLAQAPKPCWKGILQGEVGDVGLCVAICVGMHYVSIIIYVL